MLYFGKMSGTKWVPCLVFLTAWWMQHTLCLTVKACPFLRVGRFLSPFANSLLRLQKNYTTCCRVCGWSWSWPSIFVSQSIVLQGLSKLFSNILFSILPFFTDFVFFPPKQNSASPSIFPSATLHYSFFKYSENSINDNVTLWKNSYSWMMLHNLIAYCVRDSLFCFIFLQTSYPFPKLAFLWLFF